jgi:hypothetical protein
MCKECDRFEPAVLGTQMSAPSKILTYLALARMKGLLRLIKSGMFNIRIHQCATCLKRFVLIRDSSGTVEWRVEKQ